MTQEEKQNEAPEATPPPEQSPGIALVRFTFDGDTLDGAPLPDGSGDVGVCVRRLSTIFAVGPDAQLARLRRAAEKGARWATTFKMDVVAEDGKVREMVVLPRRSIPMFVATMSLGHIKEERRPGLAEKVARYHDKCAEHIADMVFGPRAPVGTDVSLLQALRTLINAALDRGKIGVVIAFANAAKGMGMDGWSQLDLFGRASCVRGTK